MDGGPGLSGSPGPLTEDAPKGLFRLLVGSDPPGHRHLGAVVDLLPPGLEAFLNPGDNLPLDAESRGKRQNMS